VKSQAWEFELTSVGWLSLPFEFIQIDLWVEVWSQWINGYLHLMIHRGTIGGGWHLEDMELDLFLHSLEAEFLLHGPIVEDRMLQGIGEIVIVADEVCGPLLDKAKPDHCVCR